MLLRLLVVLLPTLLLLSIVFVPLAFYIAYQRGAFRPKWVMIRNPASGNRTRIEIDEIARVEVEDEVESILYLVDGTRMTIKTADAERIFRASPPLKPDVPPQ